MIDTSTSGIQPAVTFEAFSKIPRLYRECLITEKIDGTNAQIIVTDAGDVAAASRSRLITPADDNHGFARWVEGNKEGLLKLGPGRHFGEWWGSGINRGYGLVKGEKRFSLFNANRWEGAALPDCVGVVPVIYRGLFTTDVVNAAVELLRLEGSKAAPGFMRPEGVIVWHDAARQLFKVTLEKDESPKGHA